MAKTLLAMGFLSANLLHFPHGPAHARRLVEALFGEACWLSGRPAAVTIRQAGRQALPRTHGYIHARAMYTGAEERGPLGLTLQTHTQAQVSAIRRVAARARGITAQRESPPHAHARSSAELLQRGWQMVGERRAATPRRAPLMRDIAGPTSQ